LLAAAVNTMNGEKCLEFGCGVGVASLCLAQRLAKEGVNHAITGIDVQSMLIDLAQKNIDINDMTPEPEFFVQDITD
jgi:tRNA1(Val) A37 N6-methylase TrmN6